MPKAYFEPENLSALAEIFAEARRTLSCRDINDPATLDHIARRILRLASDGASPWQILAEMRSADADAVFIHEEAKPPSVAVAAESIP
jgi:hypothetical protein